MCVASSGRLNQLVDDVRRRWLVGIAHAKVYNILSRRPSLLLELADDIENVGREALDALKLIFHRLQPESLPLREQIAKKVKDSTESVAACQREEPQNADPR